jgi:hypothetical protein
MRSLFLAASLILATGCSVAVVDEAGGEPDDNVQASSSQGNVAVDRVVALDDGAVSRTHVSARFVRVSGGIDQRAAERVVGTARSSDGRLVHDAPTGCSWQETPAPGAPPATGSIELLDVGDIVVRAGSRSLPLAARAFPDVGDLVSGVVYTSRDHSSELPDAVTYSIDTSGSPFVESFSAEVEAPATPVRVYLSQPRLGLERLPLDADELAFAPGEELTIAWEPGSATAGDRIYLDLASVDEDGALLRCVFEDDGEGVVPAHLTSFASGVDVDVALHRHRRVSAALKRRAGGIDEAVVDFDFAVAARAGTLE